LIFWKSFINKFIDDSSSILFSFQISILKENLIDEDKVNKSLEMLFNFLSEDIKIEFLTGQNNGICDESFFYTSF